MREADEAGGNRQLSYKALRGMLDIRARSSAEYRRAFERADADGSGYLETSEVEALLRDVVYGGAAPPFGGAAAVPAAAPFGAAGLGNGPSSFSSGPASFGTPSTLGGGGGFDDGFTPRSHRAPSTTTPTPGRTISTTMTPRAHATSVVSA